MQRPTLTGKRNYKKKSTSSTHGSKRSCKRQRKDVRQCNVVRRQKSRCSKQRQRVHGLKHRRQPRLTSRKGRCLPPPFSRNLFSDGRQCVITAVKSPYHSLCPGRVSDRNRLIASTEGDTVRLSQQNLGRGPE